MTWWPHTTVDVVEIESTGLGSAHLIPDPEAKDLSAYLVVQSGEIDNAGLEGLAHYVEHLAWLGMSGAGDAQRSATANAWTNHLATGYWISGPVEDAEANLARLSRVLKPIRVPEAQALEERGIVALEQRQRTGDPLQAMVEASFRALHDGAGHGRSVLGVPEEIARYDLEDAKRFHEMTHTPANSALILTGPISHRQAARLVSNTFGSADSTTPVTRAPYRMAAPARDIAQAEVPGHGGAGVIYTKIVEIPPREDLAGLIDRLALLEGVLTSELPGGLPKPLRGDSTLGQDFDLYLEALGNAHISIEIHARPDLRVSPQQLLDRIEQEIGSIAETGIPPETFERLHERAGRRLDEQVDPEHVLKRSLMLLERRAPVETASAQRRRLEDITVEDLDTLIDAIAGPGRVVARLIGPDRSEG